MTHLWGEPVRWDYVTFRGCMRPGCGLCRVTRHDGDRPWAEYRRMPDDAFVHFGGATPPCGGEAHA